MLDGDHRSTGHRADEGHSASADGAYDIAGCGRDVDAPVATAPFLLRRVEPGRDLGWCDGPSPEGDDQEGSEPSHASRMGGRCVALGMNGGRGGLGPPDVRPVDDGRAKRMTRVPVSTWFRVGAHTV